MIVYNEKADEEASAGNQAHQPPPPTSPRTPPSITTAGSPRPGLLHHYLQLHLNKPATTRRSSGDTEDEPELQDQPPPYTASLSDFSNSNSDELAKLLPRSCPPISYSAVQSPFRTISSQHSSLPLHANDEQPIAGPSTLPPFSPRRQIGDIDGTWTVSSDDDAVNGSAEDQTAVRSLSWTRNLQTESGNIRASISVEGNTPRRCTVGAATGSGSVNLNITRGENSSRAKIHIMARSEAHGHISINLPPDFSGIVRIRKRGSTYVHPIQLDAPFTTLVSCQYLPEGSGSTIFEYFVGDVVAAGYVKGMTDEEWTGDIVEAEAWEGGVTIRTPARSTGFVETLMSTLSPVLAYFWSFCGARWWP